jgi:HSP20 family molecular chaperone IbpA
MRQLIKRIVPCFQKITAEITSFRRPRFESRDTARTLDLEVFMPGVESDNVELVVDDRDLVVTARKAKPVRLNWQAAHFEAVQPDYQLRVRLQGETDLSRAWAALKHGILTIHIRKKEAHARLQFSVA